MISLEKSRGILNYEHSKYTEEEIKMIREFLYQMAQIDVNYFLQTSVRKEEVKQWQSTSNISSKSK